MIVTVLAACPSTMRTTFDSLLPRRIGTRAALTWSRPVKPGAGPAYKTGTPMPLMVIATFASELRFLIPVPKKLT